MKLVTKTLLGISLLFSCASQAALIHFTGSLDFYDDVDYYYFSLGASADIEINATGGFGPYLSLWNGPNGSLIGQGSGSVGSNGLGPGDYVVVVGTDGNQPTDPTAPGNNFSPDNQDPLQDGGYNVSFDGVDQVDGGDSTQVPEPGMILLMLAGIFGIRQLRNR
ncbi:DVUA0089 family protein [Neptunicella marina]|uniref:DVUA0089 family protein n=1 Tax=Neptunicella marina TaxID=2125989 RepID=A0A8J6IVA7_9ALTE|nr:DVUA0089 family protein [Neptunicella marina]MBC3767024.1 DVUA0089 family protein [Neptunicella marina]